jgi:UDP-N-acetylglucosamine acyltransferase
MLGGYAVVQDRAFLSGNGMVHQFVRIGTLAMMQGGSVATSDLPPFTVVHRVNELCGLNIVGLRRAGFSSEDRLELKRLYRMLFREGRPLRAALDEAEKAFNSPGSRLMIEFVRSSKRGICVDTGGRGEGRLSAEG